MRLYLLLSTLLLCFSITVTAQSNFQKHTLLDSIYGGYSIVAADIDGDNDLDLLTTSDFYSNAIWHQNNGNNQFDSHIFFSNDEETIAKAGDMNGDQSIDIVTASLWSNTFTLFTNKDGKGEFDSGTIFFSDTLINFCGIDEFRLTDIDNDGDLDILALSKTLYWLENTQNGTSYIKHTIDVNTSNTKIQIRDFNNDGLMDILFSTHKYKEEWIEIKWLENIKGDFKPSKLIFKTKVNARYCFEFFDIDSDGDLDLAFSEYDFQNLIPQTFWIENDQKNFEKIHTFSSFGSDIIKSADLDNDGDLDLVAFGNKKVIWYENTNKGDFLPYKTIANLPSNGLYAQITFSLEIIDIDNDGDLDIFPSSSWDTYIDWYENQKITSIPEYENIKFTITPNPTTGYLKIISEENIQQISILNSLGQIILSNKMKDTIDISQISNGVYFCNVISKNGTFTQQIVKR